MPQPWANLSAKFQDVIDLLTAQNDKLDALQLTLDYGLLTQATPPAPRIPYLLQVRVILEELKAALIGTGTDPTDIRAAIWGLAGPAPGTTLTDLYTLLARALITETTPEIPYLLQLRGALGMPPATNAESIQQILEDYKDTFGDRGGGMTLYNMLDSMYVNTTGLLQGTDAINAAIGGVPHNSLEIASVRGLLNALRLCACEGNTGPPLTGDDAICASPIRSTAMLSLPFSQAGQSSVMVARFPATLPAGFSYADTFDLGEDYVEITRSDWTGFRVWVVSESSQFAIDASATRYSTNQWIALSGSGSRAFSVPETYSLSVILCTSPEYTFVGCTTFTSQLIAYNSTPYQTILWPTDMADYLSPPDPAWSQNVYLQASAQTVYVRASRAGLLIWNNEIETITTGAWQEVAVTGGALSINDQTESTGTFTVEICDTPQT